MRRLKLGIFVIALATLMMELLLIRVFDVLLYPNMAYMVVSCALFSFGLAGIYRTLRPLQRNDSLNAFLAWAGLLLTGSILAIRPLMNALPFDYNELTAAPITQVASFLGMYLALALPFFFAGLIFATLFSAYAEQIQPLYFWDLAGAGVGCIVLIPFLPVIGPGGLLFSASALALFASALFSNHRSWIYGLSAAGIVLLVVPFVHAPDYFEFHEHLDKRGVKQAKIQGKIELTRWDPVSKIDIIELTPDLSDPWSNPRKHIAYDGGNQTSFYYSFDGNLQRLRRQIEDHKDHIINHFWQWGVLASHYLKRDQSQRVLIIGSAGGQETAAALMYGASHIDGVELVGSVIELGKTQYSQYTGNIFNHPKVRMMKGEGRSFLRASHTKYDIIQIFSNHTSSSIAAGTGAMAPNYLQTAEAYREYFEHLTPNGILHINHHVYPKMVTTAALAWRQMGRSHFQKHVVVFQREKGWDPLPTLLIKMQPWTEQEIKELKKLSSLDRATYTLVENPLHSGKSFLSADFYSGAFPEALADKIEYRVLPSTDDAPYFNFIRKNLRLEPLKPNPGTFTNFSSAQYLNAQLRKFVPMDVIHLIVTALASLLFAGVFIFVPLYFSKAGKTEWPRKGSALLYFSCLGAGFIIIELILIQIFIELIGFPIYAYSTVIFVLLLGAGIGSLMSSKWNINVSHGWFWPFVGVGIIGLLFFCTYPYVFQFFLASTMPTRIFVAFLMMFPLGFFLGMPFPLGILWMANMPPGAVAWAWAMNGLFTVVGGLASVLLSIFAGFQNTLIIALLIYAVAFLTFARMRFASG